MMNYKLIFCFLGDSRNTSQSNGYYHCPNGCGRKYKYSQGLYTHRKYECGVIPMFQCTMCRKTFKQPISYRCHMRNVHKILFSSEVLE